jgi:hypothetical protein
MPKFSGGPPTATLRAAEVRIAGVNRRAAKLAPIIKAIQAVGITSLNGISEALNERRVPTPRAEAIGKQRRCGGCWHG